MKKKIIISTGISILILAASTISAKAQIEQVTLRVDGLACPFCAYGLEKKITKLEGIKTYDVDMREGKVFADLNLGAQIELNSLYKAVKEAGFTLRSISLRARGKIGQSEDGLMLLAGGDNDKFLLFESEALSQKYHQGKTPNALGAELKKKLIQLMESGKEVLIEGVIHEHEGLPAGLAVEKLEVF